MAAAVTSFCGSTNCFGARAVGFSWGTWNSATGAFAARLDLRQAAGGGLVAGVEGGAAPGLVAVGEHLGEPEHAVHGAGADAFLQAVAGDEGEISSRHSGLPPRCEARCTTGL